MELTQEQINALLEGQSSGDSSNEDVNKFKEISQSIFERGIETMSQALGQPIVIESSSVELVNFSDLATFSTSLIVLIPFKYEINNKNFDNVILLKDDLATVIFDLLMGRDGKNPDPSLDDYKLSPIAEIINQILSSGATSISDKYNKTVKLSPPNPIITDVTNSNSYPNEFISNKIIKVVYRINIQEILESDIVHLITLKTAQNLINSLTEVIKPKEDKIKTDSPVLSQQDIKQQPNLSTHTNYAQQYQQPINEQYYTPQYAPPPPQYQQPPQYYAPPSGPPPSIQKAQFTPLVPPQEYTNLSSLDLILDIPVRVTVELGSTKMKLKEILEIGRGSVIELNRVSGEAVDLLVNGKLIAKGEVVVINENFGLRITEIVGYQERLNGLK